MQIAEQITPNGITGSSAFCEQLTSYVARYALTRVVETGTHMGLGTTTAILKGLQVSSVPFNFYTIEVNPVFYLQAKHNLGNVAGLHLIKGLSVERSQLPVDTTFDVPDHIVVDHYPNNRNLLYRKEVEHRVPDNMLDYALKQFDYCPELVVLDSAGHMGWVEFKYLMDRVKCQFILGLDDTCHVKHYSSMEYIRENPKRFEILWEVESEYLNASSGSKFGSAIIKVKCE